METSLTKDQVRRIDIISRLYKRGSSVSEIQHEVMTRLNLPAYTIATCKKDIERMLSEWKEARVKQVDAIITLELARIDEVIHEAWGAWEKSKENFKRTSQRQRAQPVVDGEGKVNPSDDVSIVSMEQEQTEETQVGDPRYLELINRLGTERRKILGLYAPEKHEVTGADGGAIKQEHSFNGFSFIPYTPGLQNSESSKIASGQILVEEKKEEPAYAEVVDYEVVNNEKVPIMQSSLHL